MWAGRLSKVGEPAIGVMATLVGCHVGPYPVEKHLLVWSYVEAGLKLLDTGGLWRNIFFPSNASKAFARSLHKLQLAGN